MVVSVTGEVKPYLPPILMVTFKRPDETREVIRKIREAAPERLFVFVDAARNPQEVDLVSQVVDVVRKEVSWECDLQVLQNDVNRGMTNAFKQAIDWFFSHVSEGVVLEDDCVPGDDFLPYCGELLDRYREDPRVLAIMGDNAAVGKILGKSSYAFVPDFSVWGWATWKRAWDHYDHDLEQWPELKKDSERLKAYWPNRIQREKWIGRFDQLYSRERDLQESNWRFMLAGLKTLGLFVLPRTNLVTNIGVDISLATSGTRGHIRTLQPAGSILPLVHPRRVAVSWFTNRSLFFSPKRRNRQYTWWYPLKKSLRKALRKTRTGR